MKKICKECGIEKLSSDFSKHKTNFDGYNNKCKLCVAEYSRQYRLKNIEKEIERANNYYQKNKDKKNEYNKKNRDKKNEYAQKYRTKNKKIISEKRKEYYKKNKSKILLRSKVYYNNRINSDPLFKLKKDTQLLVRDSFRRKNLSKNNKRTTNIIGCTIEEFKKYLESQFEPWMNWNNKGLYNGEPNFGWDIDHIIPISTAICEEDIIKLNHYTNLQPLCSYTNRVIKR